MPEWRGRTKRKNHRGGEKKRRGWGKKKEIDLPPSKPSSSPPLIVSKRYFFLHRGEGAGQKEFAGRGDGERSGSGPEPPRCADIKRGLFFWMG